MSWLRKVEWPWWQVVIVPLVAVSGTALVWLDRRAL